MSNVARQPFSGMPHMTYGTLGSPFDACATSHHPQLQRHASLKAAFLFFFVVLHHFPFKFGNADPAPSLIFSFPPFFFLWPSSSARSFFFSPSSFISSSSSSLFSQMGRRKRKGEEKQKIEEEKEKEKRISDFFSCWVLDFDVLFADGFGFLTIFWV
jgi:hypothetical protein